MKAFVSSTVSDLTEYREAVRQALSGIGLEYVTLDDLLASGAPTEAVLERLAASDVTIVVVGHRYGSVEPVSGKSWVEAEFEAARRLNKPILVFLASDDAPWPAAAIDTDRSKINRFRSEVQSNYTVGYFRTPNDLASRMTVSLMQILNRAVERKPEPAAAPSTRSVRILRLLLSSPGDVTDEREAVSRAVFRFNQQEVEENGLFIKLIRWEDMAPQIGPGAQHVINSQIGEYDIFCGIMWNRFGTPTDIAASGTEEEFRAAVEAWHASSKPWITFYFCDRPTQFTNEQQLDQKARVMRFRVELNALGVVRKYITVDEFEHMVFQDLLKIVGRLESARSRTTAVNQ